MSEALRDLAYLAACAVSGTPAEGGRVDRMDLDAVFALASAHRLSAVAAMALADAGRRDSRSGMIIARAERRAILFDHEWVGVRLALEAAGIRHMPLKGAVLKDLYPKLGMREFVDYDILIDPARAAEVRAIMEARGFDTESYGIEQHDVYVKAPIIRFEIHRVLFAEWGMARLYDYYRDVGGRLVADGRSGFGCRFTPEDFYLYMIAHEYKHYESGGTGLRSLLDTYVYLKACALDMDYVRKEAEKLGLAAFESRNRALAAALFEGGDVTDPEMLEVMLASGASGTYERYVGRQLSGSGKAAYLRKRLFGPSGGPEKAHFREQYARFYRFPLLLPFLPAYRAVRALAVHPRQLWNEIKALVRAKKGS